MGNHREHKVRIVPLRGSPYFAFYAFYVVALFFAVDSAGWNWRE
jgi:hypothetical protein